MLEVKILIEAPELVGAINNLAASFGGAKPSPAVPVSSGPLPAPVPPVAAAPVPVDAVPSAPAPVPPVATAAPQIPAPTPGIPVAAPPQYTVDQIMAAGATLMDAGKITELTNLLHSFGVQAVMDLKPEPLGAFATAMRELGAKI